MHGGVALHEGTKSEMVGRMRKSAEPELSYWRYIAGVESADQLRASRQARILAWTAAPESAKGDIVVIYGKSPVQAYMWEWLGSATIRSKDRTTVTGRGCRYSP